MKIFKPALILLLVSVLITGYFYGVILPFLEAYAPANESTTEWKFALAPLVYLWLVAPVCIGYVYCLFKYIPLVKFVRFLIYTICYFISFAAFHVLLMALGPTILWIGLITIPCGALGLLILFVLAVIWDIKDIQKFLQEKNRQIA